MAHFYAEICGHRGKATRCGTKASGIMSEVSTWTSIIRTTFRHLSEDGMKPRNQGRIEIRTKSGNYTGFDFAVSADNIAKVTDLGIQHVLEPELEAVTEAIRKLNLKADLTVRMSESGEI